MQLVEITVHEISWSADLLAPERSLWLLLTKPSLNFCWSRGLMCDGHLQDQAHIHGALIVLRCLARKYEFKDEDERQPLAAIVNGTFPTLMQIFMVESIWKLKGGSIRFAYS